MVFWRARGRHALSNGFPRELSQVKGAGFTECFTEFAPACDKDCVIFFPAALQKRAPLHTPAILAGRPWVARRIRNLNLRQHCRQLGRAFLPCHGTAFAALRPLCLRLCAVIVPCQALRWGQLRAMRCPGKLVNVVLLSRMAVDFSNDGIWLPLLEKRYGSSCREGKCAIFRLRGTKPFRDPDSLENAWTIEVEPRWRRIVQIRGYANRRPDTEVTEVIREWAQQNALKLI